MYYPKSWSGLLFIVLAIAGGLGCLLLDSFFMFFSVSMKERGKIVLARATEKEKEKKKKKEEIIFMLLLR